MELVNYLIEIDKLNKLIIERDSLLCRLDELEADMENHFLNRSNIMLEFAYVLNLYEYHNRLVLNQLDYIDIKFGWILNYFKGLGKHGE